MKQLIIILFTLTILSCKNETLNGVSKTSKPKDTVAKEVLKHDKKLNSRNKIAIDFKKNKDLLDIILLLPESSFSSWEWKLEDRIKWYNEIKENGYYTDDNPDYFNLKYFEPHRAGFSIVDGYWSITIYKTSESSFIVITNDIVGDGNNLNFYEVKSNALKNYLNEEELFLNFKEVLKKKELTENCDEEFEELNDAMFEFDFTKKNKVEIESSWYFTKEDYQNCFVGNAILYIFNPKTKRFEIEKVYWKAKEKE